MQFLRPISPLAWLPLGLVVFQKSEPAARVHDRRSARCGPPSSTRRWACARISQDYLNVGRVLKLSQLEDADADHRAADARLRLHRATGSSLGLAWLVIVAAEMLTGTPGVGGFLWQEYNSLVYAHIILSVVTIGVVGFLLDRLMGAGRGARSKTG